MYGKEITIKISAALLEASRRFFKDNLPDAAFPEDVDTFFCVAKDPKHGDLSSNVAMRLASSARRSPQQIAEAVIPLFKDELSMSGVAGYVSDVEFKGGFINVRFAEKYYQDLLLVIEKEGADYGKNTAGGGKKVNLEYVSANPTGPLTIAHGRQAAIGDALSRILRFSGYDVTNEYYLNDCGRQINMLGLSVEIRYRNLFDGNEPLLEDCYQGEYIIDMAKKVKEKYGDKFLAKSEEASAFFRKFAVEEQMADIDKDLSDFGIKFDVFTSQAGFEARNEVVNTLKELKEKGFIFENEGAEWFASTRFGDDKDRVVKKSDGSFTYLAPDMAYHRFKYQRGYDWLIDLLGPDHHGYINRMKAAVQALGHDAKSLDILIVQLATLFRGGEVVRMSTRKAEYISLREIMDEIGKDVARYYFLSRRLDSHLDFDIEVAKKESTDNPVYYVQYAHARICSINKFSRKTWLGRIFAGRRLELLKTERERQLMRRLSEFPIAVTAACGSLEPNRIVVYLNDLARDFHSFYTDCRVVTDDASLSKARLFLVECVRRVLANGLGLINVTMPEKM